MTIIVMTRVSETQLHTTYINDLSAPQPYILTVTGGALPPVGVTLIDVPAIGQTRTVVKAT